jgi:hypothetical protein
MLIGVGLVTRVVYVGIIKGDDTMTRKTDLGLILTIGRVEFYR